MPKKDEELGLEDECGVVLYGPDGKVKETRKRKHKSSFFNKILKLLIESIAGKEEEC